jgi:hypothetical protein
VTDKPERLKIENAKLLFRNFQGKPDKYNKEGNRNFSIRLDKDLAEKLRTIGWNVKTLKPREGSEDEPSYILPVSVSFAIKPPRIVIVGASGQTVLGEESCGVLDWSDIKSADLSIDPYTWKVDGKTGIKAYLKSIYVILEEDDFSEKYKDVPVNDNLDHVCLDEEMEEDQWQK